MVAYFFMAFQKLVDEKFRCRHAKLYSRIINETSIMALSSSLNV